MKKLIKIIVLVLAIYFTRGLALAYPLYLLAQKLNNANDEKKRKEWRIQNIVVSIMLGIACCVGVTIANTEKAPEQPTVQCSFDDSAYTKENRLSFIEYYNEGAKCKNFDTMQYADKVVYPVGDNCVLTLEVRGDKYYVTKMMMPNETMDYPGRTARHMCVTMTNKEHYVTNTVELKEMGLYDGSEIKLADLYYTEVMIDHFEEN